MIQFLSIIFFLGFLQFLLGFSKVPVFCHPVYKFKRQYSAAAVCDRVHRHKTRNVQAYTRCYDIKGRCVSAIVIRDIAVYSV